MKHKIAIPSYISLLLLCLIGCQQDEWQSAPQKARLTSVKATATSSAQTRTLLSGNSVIWEESDAIGIFSDASPEILRYELTSLQDNEAYFENETGVSGEEFYAFYPYSEESTTDGTTVSYHLTNQQNYRPGSFDTGNCPMVARSTSNEFRFLQTCGIIRLRLTGTMSVSALSLQGNSNEAIAGDGLIDIASDTPTFLIHGNGETQDIIRLHLAEDVQLSETETTEFHFVVPPQTFAQGLTIQITGTVDGQERSIRKQTTKSITVSRSIISSFTAIDMNAELEPEGATDRDILMALYDATNGDNWTNHTNWGTDMPLSEWYGVNTIVEDGKERVWSLSLESNNLVGTLPEEIGNLNQLTYLLLNDNELTGSIPASIGNMTALEQLYLGSNQLTGSIPAELGQLSQLWRCDLYYNQLTGEIPVSLANLTKLEVMYFYGNMLSGDLPEAVTATDWWQTYGYINVRQTAPGGFTFETFNLYMPDFTFTDYQGNTIHTADVIANNKVTLYYIWATWCPYCTRYHPAMSQIYQRYKNHALEIIGICDDYEGDPNNAYEAIESHDMEWITALGNPEGGIISNTYPTILAFDEAGKLIFHSGITDRDDLPDFLENILGPGEAPYESTDFSADKEVYTLQTASIGNGINVVLMGDAFSDRQIADGTYENLMRQGMEAFFSEEPYSSFRDMFNVYYVNAVSKTEGYVDGGETVFSCYFGEGTHVGGNDELCMQYAQKALDFTDEEMNEILIIVMMNSSKNAGTCWSYYSSAYTGDYGRGSAVAYFPAMAGNEALTEVLQHEVGHGFAKLGDEYAYEENGRIPTDEINRQEELRANYGWRKNVDFTTAPSQVYWSKFINDPRYADEQIGIFEGALTYRTGAYRPTENSIMRSNTGGFNAPSREAIYYRIHKLAYGTDWPYDYEEFVEWDMRRPRTRSITTHAKRQILTAPPVIKKARWENGGFVYE